MIAEESYILLAHQYVKHIKCLYNESQSNSHAFEYMTKKLANLALCNTPIKFLLQRDSSIRDRVSRDRELSSEAMRAFFLEHFVGIRRNNAENAEVHRYGQRWSDHFLRKRLARHVRFVKHHSLWSHLCFGYGFCHHTRSRPKSLQSVV